MPYLAPLFFMAIRFLTFAAFMLRHLSPALFLDATHRMPRLFSDFRTQHP